MNQQDSKGPVNSSLRAAVEAARNGVITREEAGAKLDAMKKRLWPKESKVKSKRDADVKERSR